MQLFFIVYAVMFTLIGGEACSKWLWRKLVAWTERIRGQDKYIMSFSYQVMRVLKETPLDQDVRKAERARKPLSESEQKRLTEWLQGGVDHAIGYYVLMRQFGRD